MKRLSFLLAIFVLSAGSANAKTVLITGSNRGIGFEFAKQYAEEGWDVIATSRSPDDDGDLQALARTNRNITIEALDVTDLDQIEMLADKYDARPLMCWSTTRG